MDDKMDFAPSDQAHRLHTASTAGYGLHQHHADQWLHSPVLGSMYQNQYTPLSFPPSSYQPAECHPQQHQNFHQHQTNIMVMEQDHSHQAPVVISSGFNGQFIDPPSCSQPVIQASPQSSTAQFPLDREQYFDQQFLQIQEARMKSFECFQQLLQLQYQVSMEQMRQFNEFFSLCCTALVHTISAPMVSVQQTFGQQQPVPTVALSQPTTFQTVSEQQQQQSMDQLIIPIPTVCDGNHHQQQQTEQSRISIAVPTPHDGSNENNFEHTQQNQPAVVFKSYDVGSLREALITIDQYRSISIKCNICDFAASADAVKYSTTFNCVYEPKFVQHLLDRNGHQMDSRSGRTSVSNDVFKWMINYGEIKIKAPHPYHHI